MTLKHSKHKNFQVCIHKRPYDSQQEAHAKILLVQQENRVSLSTYPCPMGDHWHLTKEKYLFNL